MLRLARDLLCKSAPQSTVENSQQCPKLRSMGVSQAAAGLRGIILPAAMPQAVRSPPVMTAAQVQVSSSQPRRQQTRCSLSARPFAPIIPCQKRTAAQRLHPCRDTAIPAPDALPAGPPPAKPGANWDRTTGWLVDAATVPFIFLLVPQVMKNAANLSAGNAGALAALSWVVRPPCGLTLPSDHEPSPTSPDR